MLMRSVSLWEIAELMRQLEGFVHWTHSSTLGWLPLLSLYWTLAKASNGVQTWMLKMEQWIFDICSLSCDFVTLYDMYVQNIFELFGCWWWWL